jgi:hypothetical protein
MQVGKGKGKPFNSGDDQNTNPGGKEMPPKGKPFVPPGLEKKNKESKGPF